VRPHVALATYQLAPNLAPDDQPLVPALAALGVLADAVVWSDSGVNWSAFDAVIIRSCWDYHRHIDEFRDWIERLESLKIPVWNSPRLVRWNADKRYLLDLAAKGVATVPTIIIPADTPESDVEAIVLAEGWWQVVIKPAISASGHETYALRVPFDGDARANVASAVRAGSVLVQPFAEEVARDGELSFTFIDGALSHATLKRAAPGEFRVQAEYGGSAEPVTVPEQLAEQARRVLHALPESPLYARVDGISRDGAFLLMELELIEPHLFLAHATGAADRLATAIVRRLQRGGETTIR
jgi:glutathione synthase/RimK-type ligase-like ATP-grasp enzyme